MSVFGSGVFGKISSIGKNPLSFFVSSNLDQFYEIRVAGLMQKVDAGITRHSLDGSQPKELLKKSKSNLCHVSTRIQLLAGCTEACHLANEKVFFKEIDELTQANSPG